MANNELTNKEIGNRITIARERAGMSKKDVASKINVADSTIGRYENGEIDKIKIPVIEAIANAIGANPMWIIGKDNEMERKTFTLQPAYFNLAKEMQEKNLSEQDINTLWEIFNMINKKK
jgi:transcriptional regulator with XRE-family HTH domain